MMAAVDDLTAHLVTAFDEALTARGMPTGTGREDREMLCRVVATGVVRYLHGRQQRVTVRHGDEIVELEELA